MELKEFRPFFKLSMASQCSFSIGNWRTIWTQKWLMVLVLTTGLKRSWGLKTANMLYAALMSTHWHARSYRLAGECGNSVYQKEKSLHHVQTHTHTHTRPALVKTVKDVLNYNKNSCSTECSRSKQGKPKHTGSGCVMAAQRRSCDNPSLFNIKNQRDSSCRWGFCNLHLLF